MQLCGAARPGCPELQPFLPVHHHLDHTRPGLEAHQNFFETAATHALPSMPADRSSRPPARRRLAAALVRMMQAGAQSDILRFEQASLVANGAAPSADLRHVVNAISDFKTEGV